MWTVFWQSGLVTARFAKHLRAFDDETLSFCRNRSFLATEAYQDECIIKAVRVRTSWNWVEQVGLRDKPLRRPTFCLTLADCTVVFKSRAW